MKDRLLRRCALPYASLIYALCFAAITATVRAQDTPPRTIAAQAPGRTPAGDQAEFIVRDRTTPFLLRMTGRQKVHSRLFDTSALSTRLLDVGESLHIDIERFYSALTTQEEDVRRLVCSSDAAFIATVTSSESLPTYDGLFLFTEYVVQLNEIVRQPPSTTHVRGQSVTLVRIGGQLAVNGRRLTASVNSYPPLRINSHYLIFSKYLSATQSFKTNNPDGVFSIDPGSGSDFLKATESVLATARTTACN
jgi:hypothetical protein